MNGLVHDHTAQLCYQPDFESKGPSNYKNEAVNPEILVDKHSNTITSNIST